MSLQLLFRPGLPPNTALLKFNPALPGAVTLRIRNVPRPGEPTLFLHPQFEESQAWQPTPHDITLPTEWPVAGAEGGVEVQIGPELLWHLRPGRQYEATATAAGNAPVTDRMMFPEDLVLIGDRPEGWRVAAPTVAAPRVVAEDTGEPGAPPPFSTTAPPAMAPDAPPASAPAAAVEPATVMEATAAVTPGIAAPAAAPGGKGKAVAIAASALLVAGAAAAYMFTGRPATDLAATTSEAAAPAAKTVSSALTPATSPPTDRTLASVRNFLTGNPTAEAARQQAEALGSGGQLLDGQFLLHRYAADKGDAASARALGRFYDPSTWAADKSPLPAPNPVEAARWYQKAAEAGDAEAQYRYGLLLRGGRTDDADGPERAVGWLTKAAGQGHAAAKQALGQ